jgi:predicted XRE-type DNA-binding protein
MEEIIEGSGNVYADIGIPDPESMLVKAQLSVSIQEIIESKGLTQRQAAEIVGMTQPKLSHMLNGHFRGISETKMMDCLARLGRDVKIVVGPDRPRRRAPGRVLVLQEA